MKVHTVRGDLLPFDGTEQGLRQFGADVEKLCGPDGVPLRLIITETQGNSWGCEIECIQRDPRHRLPPISSIFSFRRRRVERTGAFIAAMLIPTGIDCAIGGHAGDATTAARLLASVCDQLIVHPNVVNASDVNEQTDNSLYVEGSLVCRLLMGTIALRKVRSNRVLMVTEKREDGQWAVDQIVNTVSAARATLGVDCPKVVVLERGLSMKMGYSPSGRAVGEIGNLDGLFAMLAAERANYDAVALASKLTALTDTDELYQNYFGGEGPNPWGGAEAALTHAISAVFDIPSAHAPTLETLELRTHSYGQVDPRKAAEAISTSFSFCLLKGLHRAPAVIHDPDGAYDPSVIAAEDISCLIVPDGCLGLPMLAALLQDIPIVAVRSNKTMMKGDLRRLPFRAGQIWMVENYLEAAGLISALKAGIHPSSVNRPLARTPVVTF
jgi:uncharacterized protein DUF3326